MVVSAGVVPPLVNLISPQAPSAVITPVLRTLGNIVTGDDVQTQAVIDAGVLTRLVPLLEHTKKPIRKETCWMLSNICAGTQAQIQAVLSVPGLLDRAVHLLSQHDWEVKKEASVGQRVLGRAN